MVCSQVMIQNIEDDLKQLSCPTAKHNGQNNSTCVDGWTVRVHIFYYRCDVIFLLLTLMTDPGTIVVDAGHDRNKPNGNTD